MRVFTRKAVAGGGSLQPPFRLSIAVILKTCLAAMLVCLLPVGVAIGQASCPIESSAIEGRAKQNLYVLPYHDRDHSRPLPAALPEQRVASRVPWTRAM